MNFIPYGSKRPVFTDQSMFDQSIKLIWTSSKYFDSLIKVL